MASIDPTPEVRVALRTRLQALSGLPTVAWEGRAFSPILGTPYLKERLVSQGPRLGTLGPNGRCRTRGVWFLDVFYPAKVGLKEAEAFAANLINHFPPGKELVEDGITTTVVSAGRSGMQQETAWIMIPVTVMWFADTNNII